MGDGNQEDSTESRASLDERNLAARNAEANTGI